jgi:hypothetical protein
MRASVLENDDGPWQTAFLADRRMICCCNNHQLFVKGERLLEWRVRDRLCDKCRVELARQDGAPQNLWVAGAQFQNDPGIPPVVFAEQPRQPDGRRALHRTKPERATGFRILDGAARFIGKRKKPLGVAKQDLTGRREVQPLALTNEQRNG